MLGRSTGDGRELKDLTFLSDVAMALARVQGLSEGVSQDVKALKDEQRTLSHEVGQLQRTLGDGIAALQTELAILKSATPRVDEIQAQIKILAQTDSNLERQIERLAAATTESLKQVTEQTHNNTATLTRVLEQLDEIQPVIRAVREQQQRQQTLLDRALEGAAEHFGMAALSFLLILAALIVLPALPNAVEQLEILPRQEQQN